MAPALTSDPSGALRCICRYPAVAVAIWEGKWTAARIVPGVPLAVTCLSCAKPWTQCATWCNDLYEFLTPYRSQALGGSQ